MGFRILRFAISNVRADALAAKHHIMQSNRHIGERMLNRQSFTPFALSSPKWPAGLGEVCNSAAF